MRHQILFVLAVWAALLTSCGGMYDSLEEYSGEVVYPTRYDTIIGHIGFERVEIDLLKAGRMPSGEIKMGKATKTIVEYDDQKITIDSLVSWVNISGLDQSKLYRFKIYTIDDFGNQSVPQEIALIPYTANDLANLVIASPRVLTSPSAAVIDWPNGLSSVLLDYYGLSYKYTDKDSEVKEGERGEDSRFFMGNLQPGEQVTVQMEYKVIPRIGDVPILDTLTLVKPLELNMPTGSTQFSPTEREVLEANGVTEFTADGVASLSKLTFPIHANSLQDVFYFPNLKELDLTGGDIFDMTSLHFDRNGVVADLGGGDWIPFTRKVSEIPAGNLRALQDLLEAGILEKVKYVPHSMGLDELLAPYVESGVVELVSLPDEVLIPHKFFLDGVAQAGSFDMDVTYPATAAPAGAGLEETYKFVLRARSASIVFALPKEYKFNVEEYKYLKFKVYAPAKTSLSGEYAPYQRLWPRFMNRMWSFGGNSDFGQEYWALDADDFKIADANLEKWTDVTIDLSEALDRHTRVILMNIGGEPSLDFDPPTDIVYYFSNFRLSKE